MTALARPRAFSRGSSRFFTKAPCVRNGYARAYLHSMSLGAELLKKLDQQFMPSTVVQLRHKGLDLSIKTDENGNAILIFIGKRDKNGTVKGERYVRTLLFNPHGVKVKDHWELKGKAT